MSQLSIVPLPTNIVKSLHHIWNGKFESISAQLTKNESSFSSWNLEFDWSIKAPGNEDLTYWEAQEILRLTIDEIIVESVETGFFTIRSSWSDSVQYPFMKRNLKHQFINKTPVYLEADIAIPEVNYLSPRYFVPALESAIKLMTREEKDNNKDWMFSISEGPLLLGLRIKFRSPETKDLVFPSNTANIELDSSVKIVTDFDSSTEKLKVTWPKSEVDEDAIEQISLITLLNDLCNVNYYTKNQKQILPWSTINTIDHPEGSGEIDLSQFAGPMQERNAPLFLIKKGNRMLLLLGSEFESNKTRDCTVVAGEKYDFQAEAEMSLVGDIIEVEFNTARRKRDMSITRMFKLGHRDIDITFNDFNCQINSDERASCPLSDRAKMELNHSQGDKYMICYRFQFEEDSGIYAIGCDLS